MPKMRDRGGIGGQVFPDVQVSGWLVSIRQITN